MEEVQLDAKKRTVMRKHVKSLRREGLLPAIVYGGGIDPIPIELEEREATRILSKTSASTLINLKVGRANHTVIVREIQYDVIRRTPIHVDFLKVAMDTAIRTTVPIELVGEAPAVKDLGAVQVLGINEIEVEALPSDLPDRIPVDLEALTEIDSILTVGDLFISKEVTVFTESDEVIVHIVPQAVVEEEEEEVEMVIDVGAEPEVIEKGLREEEEGEEGKEA